jgi:cytoskeletal protein CcmA (bactofilin family)
MAGTVSIIGKTTRIRGRVTGAVDLEVQGLVDGEIAVDGDVTIDVHGMVGAGVRGRRLVVRGAVKGDLLGDEAVVLEDGARVVGDVRAPRVAIATGALVRGFVETGEGGAVAPKGARAHTAGRPVAAQPARAAVAPPAAKPQPVPAHTAAKPAAKALAVAGHSAAHAGGTNNAHAPGAPRRPPPPVVPSLKKAKGQIAKKKER